MNSKDHTYSLDQYFSEDKPCLSFNIEDLNHTPPYNKDDAHRHDYYEIYLFDEGHGTHTIDFEEYTYNKHGVSVVFPRQFHKLVIDPNSKGTIIMFNEELFCSEILRKELRAYCIDLKMRLNNMTLSETQYQQISMLFQLIKSSITDLNVMRKEQFRHLIKVLLLKLMDFSKTKELTNQETTESDLYFEFSNLVDNQFKNKRLVIDYADQLGISTKKLNILSKKHSGQTALHVIHERIFQEAKHLLAFSGLSHKEIAYDLKFDSPSAFNKFIHNKSGYTPTQLQQRLTQIYNKAE